MLVLINIFLGFTALASALSASNFVTAELVLSAPGALKFISNGMVVPTTRTPSPVSGIYITVTSISPLTLTASWPTFFRVFYIGDDSLGYEEYPPASPALLALYRY